MIRSRAMSPVRWAQTLGGSFLRQQPFGEVHALLELTEPALHVVEPLREARDIGLGGSLPRALVRASDEPSRHNVSGRDHNDDERGADGPARNHPHAPPPARLLRGKEAPVGIEPTNRGFAVSPTVSDLDPSDPIWLRRQTVTAQHPPTQSDPVRHVFRGMFPRMFPRIAGLRKGQAVSP